MDDAGEEEGGKGGLDVGGGAIGEPAGDTGAEAARKPDAGGAAGEAPEANALAPLAMPPTGGDDEAFWRATGGGAGPVGLPAPFAAISPLPSAGGGNGGGDVEAWAPVAGGKTAAGGKTGGGSSTAGGGIAPRALDGGDNEAFAPLPGRAAPRPSNAPACGGAKGGAGAADEPAGFNSEGARTGIMGDTGGAVAEPAAGAMPGG